jgi:hypothetical protein
MKDFKAGDVVRYVSENGWTTNLFKIHIVYPSDCKEGNRYYGRDINDKAFAAQQNQIYTSSKAELAKWNEVHK